MSTQLVERMAVEIDGSGDAVVMIHGLGGTSNTFTPQMGVFGGRFRVVRPDLPGSGRTKTSGALSIPGFTQKIVAMAGALGIERAHLVAHSMGTIICQHIAAEHVGFVRSMVLFGPFPEPPAPARQGLRDRAAAARAEGMAPIADAIVAAATSADTRTRQPVVAALVREMVMRQDPEGYAGTCEALSEARAADLSRIGCPALLVTGDDDPIAPPSVVRSMAERMGRTGQARAVVLNRCGHWTTFERAAEVNDLLKDFYRASM
jgi:3-oxoadipate enol-lactonase